MREVRTRQLRVLRNSLGGFDAIFMMYVDEEASAVTTALNAAVLAGERNPYVGRRDERSAPLSLAEIDRRLVEVDRELARVFCGE